MEAKMDDLPILAFERILGYLSLADRIRSRAVSRGWRDCIDSLKVKSLFCSNRPIGFIYEKSRWVSGAFAQNFISSPRIEPFFGVFANSILVNLKHLRLGELELNRKNRPAFAQALESFGQLEKLDLFNFIAGAARKIDLKLNLPMLNSIQLENLFVIGKLTLDTPRLRKIKLWCCYTLRVDLVHGESVERLLIDRIDSLEVKNLTNLRYLYASDPLSKSTLLSSLEHLNEIYLFYHEIVSDLFEQKKKHGRVDLKIYLCGLLLSGPNDPTISCISNFFNEETLGYLAENLSRLADEIPLLCGLNNETIERVWPKAEIINLLSRFTDLSTITLNERVQDIERFLKLLENCDNIVALFFYRDQPQDLFDRLPEHCAVQKMYFSHTPSDLSFLSRLKNLSYIYLDCSIDIETIRKVLEELPFLLMFRFDHFNKQVEISIEHPKRLRVWVEARKISIVTSPEAAIEFIINKCGRRVKLKKI